MTASKGIVVGTNILLRAILGNRVRAILKEHKDRSRFYSPDLVFTRQKKLEAMAAAVQQTRTPSYMRRGHSHPPPQSCMPT